MLDICFLEYVFSNLHHSKLKTENYSAEILCHDSESGVTVKKIIQMYV